MKRILSAASTAALATLLAACATTAPPPAPAAAMEAPPHSSMAVIPAKNARLAAFFDAADKAELAMSPIGKAYRGIKDGDYGNWDQFTDGAALAERELGRRLVADLQRQFPRESLSPDDQLSYDLFLYRDARFESIYPYRERGYVFDQMNGAQSDGPAFLINIHKVDNVADADAYVSRIREIARYLGQSVAEARGRQAQGVLPPKWVFPYIIADSRNVISGAPFSAGKDSALWADFKAKVDKLNADAMTKKRLLDSARAALLDDLRPAYQSVIALMQTQQKAAGTDDGSGAPTARSNNARRNMTRRSINTRQFRPLVQQLSVHGEMEAIRTRSR